MDKVINKIIKRDGREVEFEVVKLVKAIEKAGIQTGEFKTDEAKRLAEITVALVAKSLKDGEIPQVEKVQDFVEQVLMAGAHYKTAKAYILYRVARSDERRFERIIGVKDDLDFSSNQLKVMRNRYLLKNSDGKVIETPSELFHRVAKNLAIVEKSEKRKKVEADFYEVMSKLEFLPAGRTLNNAGTPQSQLANCFVLPVEDSMEGIFDSVKWMAMIQQRGGGTGFNFSKLRPRGDVVTKSSGGFATGPVSFMKVFDIATRQVMQGGKKRGANMGILNVDHPDILDFISAKSERGEIENFNISVGVTDDFMKAVDLDKEWHLRNQRTGEIVQTMQARTLMGQLVSMAWRTGDPGLIFLDPINRNNPLLEKYGRIDATNPCGEQPLHPFDACNLGSINLSRFIDSKEIPNSKLQTPNKKEVNWERLRFVVRTGVRMLDNVIDACKYPLPQITETVRANRRIGLGVMGWADMLYQLRIPYDSEKGVKLAKKVAKYIQDVSWEMSRELAKEKGEFPRWKDSSHKEKVRNVAITTIAPTGSISMLSDASSGIEPVFALAYTKNVVEDNGLSYINKYFERELSEAIWADGDAEHKVRDRIVREVVAHGTVNPIMGVPKEVKLVYRTAHDISPEWHVKMQAAWQKYTDNAVSKTINFPHSATIDDVENAYMMAWKLGCKGITIYRDGSKEIQILSVGSSTQETVISQVSQIIQSKIKTETLKERGKRLKSGCPECGGKLAIEEGCAKCYGCGFSVCQG
ncbi:ribonucleoside-diphosphate reductase, adenosylcobalamin-dependent [Candidatus Collierbacteria bacterium CG09_land_8_20_14_0_10_46_12]|uniref:Vitamin B12-dependent ribonucleotide reductase n=2 Tax=Candidatus Collieribacteriota TaxID=1752725 RepID=A0A2H0WZF0_9BACT|nr:MAG: ribonucleoside-diphosphate reductase, adenosylcobalamin-dependent [Candidatus Collierbacteria bacterium CG09_land_8_20_14_0_10_46_12]